jgi:hypothetical protein
MKFITFVDGNTEQLNRDQTNNNPLWCVVDLFGSGYCPMAGFCGYENELASVIKGGTFFDYFSDYQLLCKGSCLAQI